MFGIVKDYGCIFLVPDQNHANECLARHLLTRSIALDNGKK